MAERGILFSAPMVCAILAGKKTVTRRIVKPRAAVCAACLDLGVPPNGAEAVLVDSPYLRIPYCPHNGCGGERTTAPYLAGDRLWVREAWRVSADYDDRPKRAGIPVPPGAPRWYDADRKPENLGTGLDIGMGDSGHDGAGNWTTIGRYRHARFMPRWASRIDLDAVSVRVERLHEIDDDDAIREGATTLPDYVETWETARECYARLWDAINVSVASWDSNPWVFRIEFSRVSRG